MKAVYLPLFDAHEMCKIKSGETNYIELSGDFYAKSDFSIFLYRCIIDDCRFYFAEK